MTVSSIELDRKSLADLAVSGISKNLIHVFRLRERARKDNGVPDGTVAAPVRSLGVVGAASAPTRTLGYALRGGLHAADMRIAYLPRARAVVESDLLQPWINPVFGGGRSGPHPYLVYLFDELERLNLGYEQFVPIHRPAAPPTMKKPPPFAARATYSSAFAMPASTVRSGPSMSRASLISSPGRL